MRSYSLSGLLASTMGLFAARANAQTGTVSDLGTLLAGQKNLTTFYTLIQVSLFAGQYLGHATDDTNLGDTIEISRYPLTTAFV